MSAKPLPITSSLQFSDLSMLANRSKWPTTACILAADFVVLTFVFALTILGRHVVSPSYGGNAYLEFVPFLCMILIGFWIQGLYPGVLLHPAEEMRRIYMSVTTVFLVMTCSAFLWRNVDSYSRSVFLIMWSAGPPLFLLTRYVTRRIFRSCSWWGVPAVVLGSGITAQRVSRTLQDGRWGIHVAGVLTDGPATTWPQDLPQLLGSLEEAPRLSKSKACEYAIVAMPNKSSQEIRNIIQTCCQGFRRILFVPDMPGFCGLGIVTRQLGGEIGFEVPQRLFHVVPAAVKRTLDLAVSLAGILCLLPVFLVLSICVRLSSKGPIFYGQDRYGRDGQIFKALKFRTMVTNADRILADHLAKHPEDLFEWQRDHKLRKDPRITAVGKWMRRLSLDELPQLFNVLAGQMSLVGPRPIVKAEIEKYGDRYILYSRVRPGITGMWQVSGRNNTTYEERVTLDEYYVNNWSVWLDTYILVRTFRTVVTAEGAY